MFQMRKSCYNPCLPQESHSSRLLKFDVVICFKISFNLQKKKKKFSIHETTSDKFFVV